MRWRNIGRFIVLVLFAAPALIYFWSIWPGCFSYNNYDKIRVGMNRERAVEILGSEGEVTKSIPGFPPYVHLPGAPPQNTGVVWGDVYVQWTDGDRTIYIGFANGVVTSKYFDEYSF